MLDGLDLGVFLTIVGLQVSLDFQQVQVVFPQLLHHRVVAYLGQAFTFADVVLGREDQLADRLDLDTPGLDVRHLGVEALQVLPGHALFVV